jgi:hypothetical protein
MVKQLKPDMAGITAEKGEINPIATFLSSGSGEPTRTSACAETSEI